MVVDNGLGFESQQELIEVGEPFIDMAKIAVGISGLLPLKLLQRKIEVYHSNDILAFPGGQYLEYAIYHGKTEAYFEHCAEAGFKLIEVSDNVDPLPRNIKQEIISRAVEGYGFQVLGEPGWQEVAEYFSNWLNQVKV